MPKRRQRLRRQLAANESKVRSWRTVSHAQMWRRLNRQYAMQQVQQRLSIVAGIHPWGTAVVLRVVR
jgi:hypothetical protein